MKLRFALLAAPLAIALFAPEIVRGQDEAADTAGAPAEVDAEVEAEVAGLIEAVAGMLRRGQYNDARRRLSRIEELAPHHLEGTLLRGRLLRETGKRGDALAILAPLTDSVEAQRRRGEIAIEAGRLEESDAAFRRALELDADDLPSHAGLARLRELNGDRDGAVEAYIDVNSRWAKREVDDSIDDLLAVAHSREAIFRLSEEFSGSPDSILSRLEEAYRMDKSDVRVLVALGDLYLRMDQDQDAKRHYEDALDVNAYYVPAIVGLAHQKAFRFDDDGARQDVQRALRTDATYVPGLVYLARIALGDGRYAEATEHIDNAIAANPVSADARAARATLLYLQGNRRAFDEEIAAMLERDRHASVGYRFLASVLEEQRRFADAYTYARRAIEVDGRDWEAYFLAGRNAMNVGEDELAEELLNAGEAGDLYRNLYRRNFITLFRKMQRFPTKHDARFVVRLPFEEQDSYYPLLLQAMSKSLTELETKWGIETETPLFISVFDQQADFATRTIGLPGFPALGACFGRVITLDSPRALPPGAFGWRATEHHELAHTITLQLSGGRVPRWLTEGVSVYEERKVSPIWDRESERDLVDALASDEVLSLAEINGAFRGRRVMFAYYQGGLMCELIERDFGFPALRELVRQYADGVNTPTAVRNALGVDPEEFDRLFIEYARDFTKNIVVMPRPSKKKVSRLRRRLRREKTDVEGWVLLAHGHVAAGKTTDALAALSHVTKLAPDDGRIPLLRAFIGIQQGRPDMAKRFGEEAIEKGADVFDVRRLLSELAIEDEDFEAAKTHLRRAIELYPTVTGGGSPRLQLAGLIMGEGDEKLDEAMQLMQDHANIAEDDHNVRLRLAGYYRDRERADDEFRILLETRDIVPLPNGPQWDRASALALHLRVAEIQLEREQHDEAVLSLGLAVGVGKMDLGDVEGPLDPLELSDLYVGYAQGLELVGRTEDAVGALDDALRADPDNEDAHEMRDRLVSE